MNLVAMKYFLNQKCTICDNERVPLDFYCQSCLDGDDDETEDEDYDDNDN